MSDTHLHTQLKNPSHDIIPLNPDTSIPLKKHGYLYQDRFLSENQQDHYYIFKASSLMLKNNPSLIKKQYYTYPANILNSIVKQLKTPHTNLNNTLLQDECVQSPHLTLTLTGIIMIILGIIIATKIACSVIYHGLLLHNLIIIIITTLSVVSIALGILFVGIIIYKILASYYASSTKRNSALLSYAIQMNIFRENEPKNACSISMDSPDKPVNNSMVTVDKTIHLSKDKHPLLKPPILLKIKRDNTSNKNTISLLPYNPQINVTHIRHSLSTENISGSYIYLGNLTMNYSLLNLIAY